MKITALTTPQASLDALKKLNTTSEEVLLAYAWISATGPQWRALELHKVKKAIVGVHFAQTDPAALRSLAEFDGDVLRVIPDASGVFHPKIIVGVQENGIRAIVGSSNLTRGGFAGNTEVNLLVEGTHGEQELASLVCFIEELWGSARAFRPDEDWLARYEETFKARPSAPIVPPPRADDDRWPVTLEDLEVEWSDYFALIAAQESRMLSGGWPIFVFDHPEGSYLQEIEACLNSFKKSNTFAEMPLPNRQRAAGTGGGTSGAFGSMKGAGYFRNIVRETPEAIGTHLDAIPQAGPVGAPAVAQYLSSMEAIPGIAIATASRLLAVKRPDLFLPVNDGNRTRIRDVFGKAPWSISGYLRLHEQIWSFPWVSAPRPHGTDEGRVWKARVALLDAIFYDQ